MSFPKEKVRLNGMSEIITLKAEGEYGETGKLELSDETLKQIGEWLDGCWYVKMRRDAGWVTK